MSDPDGRTQEPNLAAYAAERGLYHRENSMALPQATQLLRHGFMREVPSLVRGDLPGGARDAFLAQADYVSEGRNDLERSYFTLVLIEAPESLGFAVRVLCHDRDLSKLDMTNPDSEREVIEADDRAVQLESEDFLRRYALFTDNDQDQLSVWRLFAPTLIAWLTAQAPVNFSFELQDGALCCFVPGTISDPASLDELCEASARVLKEVARVGSDSGVAERGGPAVGANRPGRVDAELAEHPFDSPPASVKAAAKAFRRGPFIGDGAWKLGAEAFFREQAATSGFRRIDLSEFRASHMQTFLPGVLAHVAVAEDDGWPPSGTFLIFTDNAEYEDMGWTALVADGISPMLNRGMAPGGVSAERGLVKSSFDARSMIYTTLDGGPRDRTAVELGSFLATCRELLDPSGSET